MKFVVASAILASVSALQRGNAYPATILPGSVPILPIASAPLFLQTLAESGAEAHIRHKLQHKLRKALKREHYHLSDDSLLMLQDEGDDTVASARIQAAQMQAQLDQAVADADAKREQQKQEFENRGDSDDPASQLKGLMNAQASLHRLTSAFSAKPNLDKVSAMAQKLGIPMTPELMQLGNNEAISNALVEIAVGMGKNEDEISKALGAE
jgi:hypothetical protein